MNGQQFQIERAPTRMGHCVESVLGVQSSISRFLFLQKMCTKIEGFFLKR